MNNNKLNIVAIIPARSGSKGIPNKNIRIMNGKPLIAYSIEQALASTYIDRVIVSTDSAEYATIACQYGAEVPFLRPKEISDDLSLDIDLFENAYYHLCKYDNYTVDIFVHLRPTHPIRNVYDIDKMIELLINNPDADAIRSISPSLFTPYKMWFYDESSNQIYPVIHSNLKEAYNLPRQILPQTYEQNACIDVVRSKTITGKHSMTGEKILGYKMEYDYDIDTEEDFLNVERIQLLHQVRQQKKKLKIVCDIDGIIANKMKDNDYSISTPVYKNIDIINKLYEEGHTIILFTARGYRTGLNWEDLTIKQLQKWNVKYHSLLFGKPDADIYIDDKFFDLTSIESLVL